MTDEARVAEVRARFRRATPTGYRWALHVALVATFTAVGLALPLSRLDGFGLVEAAALALMLIAIVLGEYASHRWSMHVPRFPRAVHHRHVLEHHAFFTERDMAIDGWGDLRWVLFPPWALPLLVASVSPFVALLRWLASPPLAWLFLAAVIGYYGVYEVVHVLAHLPARGGPVGRLVAGATRRHRIHHDPARMRRWNFNFVVPLGDRLFGTLWRADRNALDPHGPPGR